MTVSLQARQSAQSPPTWALLQRQLFAAIEDAAPQALQRYTHPDGRLLWPPIPDFESITSHAAVRGNPELAERLGQAMRERMGRGDAVVNLLATTLGANAYLLTADAKYRNWVVEYTEGWMGRADANGGIVPDNVGLSGVMGEHINGKWYGSSYGWAWPHGWHSVGQAVGVAAQNCALLTRRLAYMDFPRSQIDVLIARGIERDDQLYVPHKYDDPGRVSYQPGEWMWYPVRNKDGTALQEDGWFEFMTMYPRKEPPLSLIVAVMPLQPPSIVQMPSEDSIYAVRLLIAFASQSEHIPQTLSVAGQMRRGPLQDPLGPNLIAHF